MYFPLIVSCLIRDWVICQRLRFEDNICKKQKSLKREINVLKFIILHDFVEKLLWIRRIITQNIENYDINMPF